MQSSLTQQYFNLMDAQYAQRGMYRLTAANQAIHDEVYTSPMHRLSELEGKLYSSMRYRTCSASTPIREMLEVIFGIIDKRYEEYEDVNERLRPLGVKAKVTRPWNDEYSYEECIIEIVNIEGVSHGSSFEKIVKTEFIDFHYPSCLYEDSVTQMPTALIDGQRVVDIYNALKPQFLSEYVSWTDIATTPEFFPALTPKE